MPLPARSLRLVDALVEVAAAKLDITDWNVIGSDRLGVWMAVGPHLLVTGDDASLCLAVCGRDGELDMRDVDSPQTLDAAAREAWRDGWNPNVARIVPVIWRTENLAPSATLDAEVGPLVTTYLQAVASGQTLTADGRFLDGRPGDSAAVGPAPPHGGD